MTKTSVKKVWTKKTRTRWCENKRNVVGGGRGGREKGREMRTKAATVVVAVARDKRTAFPGSLILDKLNGTVSHFTHRNRTIFCVCHWGESNSRAGVADTAKHALPTLTSLISPLAWPRIHTRWGRSWYLRDTISRTSTYLQGVNVFANTWFYDYYPKYTTIDHIILLTLNCSIAFASPNLFSVFFYTN